MLPPQSMVKISVLFQLCAVAAVTLTASAAALGLEDDDVRNFPFSFQAKLIQSSSHFLNNFTYGYLM